MLEHSPRSLSACEGLPANRDGLTRRSATQTHSREVPGSNDDDPRVARLAGTYDAFAEVYRELWSPVLLPLTVQLLNRLPLASARLVVDVGAGVGTAMPAIREEARSATIVGVDRSIGMMQWASPTEHRAVMDASRLALRSSIADVVVAAFMLFHLPDPFRGLVEIGRVIKRGGSIGLTTWGREAEGRAWSVWRDELDVSGAPALSADNRISNHDAVDTPAKLGNLLSRAGFTSVHVDSLPLNHQIDLAAFVDFQVRYSSAERLASLTPRARARFIDRAIERLGELSDEDFTDRSEVLVVTAIA